MNLTSRSRLLPRLLPRDGVDNAGPIDAAVVLRSAASKNSAAAVPPRTAGSFGTGVAGYGLAGGAESGLAGGAPVILIGSCNGIGLGGRNRPPPAVSPAQSSIMFSPPLERSPLATRVDGGDEYGLAPGCGDA